MARCIEGYLLPYAAIRELCARTRAHRAEALAPNINNQGLLKLHAMARCIEVYLLPYAASWALCARTCAFWTKCQAIKHTGEQLPDLRLCNAGSANVLRIAHSFIVLQRSCR